MGSGGSGANVGGVSGAGDGGYNGGGGPKSFAQNLEGLKEKFAYEDGYFGEEGSSVDKRRIASEDPLETAREFYRMASEGGVEAPMPTGEGVMSVLKDGTVVSFREVSKSEDKSPAVDISIRKSTDSGDVKKQRIHFILDEGGKE